MIYRQLPILILLAAFLPAGAAWAQEQTFPGMADGQPGVPGATTSAPPSDIPVSRAALPQLKIEELSATRERPLFVQERRPVPPPPAPVAIVTGPPKKQMPLLRGIIVSSLSTIVVLQDASTSDSIIINSGDTFGPWKVVAESDHSVSLTEGDKKISLDLFGP